MLQKGPDSVRIRAFFWRVAVIEIIGKKPLFLVACGFLDFDFSFFATVIQTIAEKLEFTQKRYVHIT
jgi:hypothetical protein